MTNNDITKKNVYQCYFCNKILSSRQGLYYHKKHTRSCLQIQNANLQAKLADPRQQEIDRLQRQLDLLRNPVAIEPQTIVHRPENPVRQYSLRGDGELEYFDEENYEHINGLHEHVLRKCENNGEMYFEAGQTCYTCVYSFFFPRFYQCTDTKRFVFKYKDKDGNVVIDPNLENLVRITKPILRQCMYPILQKQLEFWSLEPRKLELVWQRHDDIVGGGDYKAFFVDEVKLLVDPTESKTHKKWLRQVRAMFG
jgi:hypothetical protein